MLDVAKRSKRAPSAAKQLKSYVRAMSRSKHALNSTTKALAEEVSRIEWQRKVA